jgi:hypothetical protein
VADVARASCTQEHTTQSAPIVERREAGPQTARDFVRPFMRSPPLTRAE